MGLTKPGLDSIIRVARASRSYSRVKPYPFLKQVSNVDFARIQGALVDYPGFYATARTIRSYPKKSNGQYTWLHWGDQQEEIGNTLDKRIINKEIILV